MNLLQWGVILELLCAAALFLYLVRQLQKENKK
jgi:hypothetical protein